MDEFELRVADPNHVVALQQIISLDHIASDAGAVAAIQIAEGPVVLGQKDLGMMPAATLILDDNMVRGRPANGYRLSRQQPEDVGPLRPFPNNKICQHE